MSGLCVKAFGQGLGGTRCEPWFELRHFIPRSGSSKLRFFYHACLASLLTPALPSILVLDSPTLWFHAEVTLRRPPSSCLFRGPCAFALLHRAAPTRQKMSPMVPSQKFRFGHLGWYCWMSLRSSLRLLPHSQDQLAGPCFRVSAGEMCQNVPLT